MFKYFNMDLSKILNFKVNQNINKRILTSCFTALIITSSNVYAAINIDLKATANLYFGAGMGYNKYVVSNDFKSIVHNNQGRCDSGSLNLLTPIIGMQFNDKYGIEIGYSIYNDLQFSGNKSGNLEIRNYFLDVTGAIPAPSFLGEQLDFIGGIGIGRIHLKENGILHAMGNGSSYNKFGFRIKVGMLYPLDQNWNIRGTLGYQGLGSKDAKNSINSVRSFNLDLLYSV